MANVINLDELQKNLQLVYNILVQRGDQATNAAVKLQNEVYATKAETYQSAAFLLDGFCSCAGVFLKKLKPETAVPEIPIAFSRTPEMSIREEAHIFSLENPETC